MAERTTVDQLVRAAYDPVCRWAYGMSFDEVEAYVEAYVAAHDDPDAPPWAALPPLGIDAHFTRLETGRG